MKIWDKKKHRQKIMDENIKIYDTYKTMQRWKMHRWQYSHPGKCTDGIRCNKKLMGQRSVVRKMHAKKYSDGKSWQKSVFNKCLMKKCPIKICHGIMQVPSLSSVMAVMSILSS